MAELEFKVLDKEKGKGRDPHARYEIIVGGLDGNPEMYDLVSYLEGNDGNLHSYRDCKTTAGISVENATHRTGEDSTHLILVGVGEMDETLSRLKSVVPDIFDFKGIAREA